MSSRRSDAVTTASRTFGKNSRMLCRLAAPSMPGIERSKLANVIVSEALRSSIPYRGNLPERTLENRMCFWRSSESAARNNSWSSATMLHCSSDSPRQGNASRENEPLHSTPETCLSAFPLGRATKRYEPNLRCGLDDLCSKVNACIYCLRDRRQKPFERRRKIPPFAARILQGSACGSEIG